MDNKDLYIRVQPWKSQGRGSLGATQMVNKSEYEKVIAKRDQLAAKLSKLDHLATRFIEDSEEIAEFFEASGGRNHLILANDVTEIAEQMANMLNDHQSTSNRNELEALRDAIQACENQGYRVMYGNNQITGAILSGDVIELVN